MNIIEEASKIIEATEVKELFCSFGCKISGCKFIGENIFNVVDFITGESKELFRTTHDFEI
jgi:hypothetical protein